jgi:hypothetical protein
VDPPSESEATCSVKAPPCERPSPLNSTGPRSGPGNVVLAHHHLIDPIRPTRGHSTTSSHGDLYVRLRCAGAPRRPASGSALCLSILPSMSSSTSPGSRPLHVSSSFAMRICAGELSARHSRCWRFRGLLVHHCYDLLSCSPPLLETFTSGLSRARSSSTLPDMMRWQLDNFHRRDSHPLDRRLVSLHNSLRLIRSPRRRGRA